MTDDTKNVEGTVLHLDDSPYEYNIVGELGRGGTSVLYDGFYVNHTGAKRPVRIREIKLKNDRGRQQVRNVFDLNNKLFETAGLTNRIVNTYEIHETENSVYIITTYQEGTTLDRFKPDDLRDAVGAVRGLAHTLELLHDAGYLYLDVKPENVLVLEGGTDWVQLFDFDSVVRMEMQAGKTYGSKKTDENAYSDVVDVFGKSGEKALIRFTREFAAYEQKMRDIRHIGPWTDVYGVGTVLFFMLFNRAPDVFDCDESASYDVERCLSGGWRRADGDEVTSDADERISSRHVYRDGLADHISDILHRTLARSYKDRYQTMHELVEALDKLYAEADETKLYVKSSRISASENIVGRNDELQYLKNWFDSSDVPCIYVTGMGGIGKSTIVRRFLVDNRKLLDTEIYLEFAGSVAETVCDDDRFWINTVNRQKEESLPDYFHRKLRKLSEYLTEENKNCIIVIDNYEHGYEEELDALINAGCRLVVVTRDERVPGCHEWLRVDVFADRQDMYELMMWNLTSTVLGKTRWEQHIKTLQSGTGETHRIDKILSEKLDCLIDSVHGHTLMLMLISRQISRGYMSIDEACMLVSQSGFAALDDVKACCTVDGRLFYGHMTDLIARLFRVDRLGAVHRRLLVTLSLFGDNGVYVRDLIEITGRDILNAANELIDGGWVECYSPLDDSVVDNSAARLALHPVIAQSVRTINATTSCDRGDLDMAISSLERIDRLLRQKRRTAYEWEKKQVHMTARNWKVGQIRNPEKDWQYGRGGINIRRWEKYGMTAADNCLGIADLAVPEEYMELAVQITTETCIENEEFILRHGRILLERTCGGALGEFVQCGGRPDLSLLNYENKCVELTDEKLVIIADRMAHIYTDRGEQAASEKILQFLDSWSQTKSSYVRGLVCDVWSDYLDSMLDGCFTPESDNEKDLYSWQMQMMDQAIELYEQSDEAPARCRLAADLIAKATYLIRTVDYEHDLARIRTRREAVSILNQASRVMDGADSQFNLQNRHAYFMAKAWFYTYIEPDIEKAERSIRNAQKTYSIVCESELDLINYLMIPAANIYLELGDMDRCKRWLRRAVRVCEKNDELAAFCRKKEEVEEILGETY